MNGFTKAVVLIAAALASIGAPAAAQDHIPGRVEIAWNRYYTVEEVDAQLRAIADAYPDLVRLDTIGRSREGREMTVAVVTNFATGSDREKPAMWIDGSVHANEVQATEVVMYTLWYLTKAHGVNEPLTELLDTTAFYLMPIVNPDSRVRWLEGPATPHFYRLNQRPVDDDRDGRLDEDHMDDLDGDGHFTRMWKRDPNGRWLRSQTDPRVFVRAGRDERGDWTMLGWEGIDNDGDGRINEDGPGGDDMNRNWPAGWQPSYVQRGAGEYALSNPETRAVGEYMLDRPNIAAAQSYHNTGGMLLRGPGTPTRASMYPREDLRVYDELGELGEEIIPYFDYLVVYEDLYTVHGGFVTWAAEGLGVISFTNELWTTEKYFQRDVARPDQDRTWIWRDRLAFGQVFTDYAPYDHPQYGEVLVGGPNKWASRSTPTFMLEEECHRNFAFTVFHAEQMPRLRFDRVETEPLGGGLWAVTAEVRNDKVIPTRTAHARAQRIGAADVLTIAGPEPVVAGRLDGWFDRTLEPARGDAGRLLVPEGVGGRSGVIARFVVRGAEGDEVTLRFESDKAAAVESRFRLTEGR